MQFIHQTIEKKYNVALDKIEHGKNIKKCLEGIKELEKIAEEGFLNAQLKLGDLYYEGRIITRDVIRSLYWYEKAAKQGDAIAQYNVAIIYRYGNYIEKDQEKSFKLFKMSAEQGMIKAQNELGMCYEKGIGVERDIKKAMECYEKASEQGDAYAQYNAAMLYREQRDKDFIKSHGTMYEPNLVKAYNLFKKSAKQGFAKAQNMLGSCYEHGLGTEKSINLALEWFLMGAEQGEVHAQNNAAYIYIHKYGKKEKGNLKKAVELLKQSASNGNFPAYNMLGKCYKEGWGVEKDTKKAVECYEEAANNGVEASQYNLGVFYWRGEMVEKNILKAVEFFEKAAAQGCSLSKTSLAMIYEKGENGEKNFEKAIELYEMAAEQGVRVAVNKLAMWYAKGEVVEKNILKALSLFKKISYNNEEDRYFNETRELLNTIYMLGQDFELIDNGAMHDKAIECYEMLYHCTYEEFRVKALERLKSFGKDIATYEYMKLAKEHMKGRYIKKSAKNAYDYLVIACHRKHSYAQFIMACLALENNEIFLSVEEIKEWIDFDDSIRQKYGKGVLKNNSAAAYIFMELVAQKTYDNRAVDALFGLAHCYFNGIGVEQNFALGQKYFREFKQNHRKQILNKLDISLYADKYIYSELKMYLKKYYDEQKNKCRRFNELNILDLSLFFDNAQQAYKFALEFDFGDKENKLYAIMIYSYAAYIGSKKALYSLLNMAMEETEYFIDVPLLTDGGEL